LILTGSVPHVDRSR
jgi:hypothetical protein